MPKRKNEDSSGEPASKAAKPSGKLWGGRFTGKTDPLMEKFNASIHFDRRLHDADIRGSVAYAKALNQSGILSDSETKTICDGLEKVNKEWHAGSFVINEEVDEDIHTANERRLTELVGTVAGKLHTGRSRNDQVATDVRLWLHDQILIIRGYLVQFLRTICDRAEKEIDILMPGYTHLQPAQPIRWSHWMLSHAAAVLRDLQRLDDVDKRVRMLPLGCGALAGNPFSVDRNLLATLLAANKSHPWEVSHNSLDATSDRDFIAEFLFVTSMLGVHLTKFAEDLIIYSSKEFSYVSIADAYSTGSSLMPQKRNPDALELLRGKSGRTIGGLICLLTTLKGIPTAYNKDLQEDKEPLFDAVDTLSATLQIATGVISTLTPNVERMRGGLTGEMLATDLAEYLVRMGVPFRDTHHIAGAAVKLSEDKKVSLTDLTAADLKGVDPRFGDDVTDVWDFERSVETRNAAGGTAKSSVLAQIKDIRKACE